MNIFWWVFPLVLMLVLLVIKVPVAYAIIFPSLIYFMFGQEYASAEMMVQKMVTTTETFTYLAVPFFVFASVVFNYAGITRRLMDLANLVVGHLKGGLAHVNILLSMMMGGLSGSSLADAAQDCKLLVPQMENYDAFYTTDIRIFGKLLNNVDSKNTGGSGEHEIIIYLLGFYTKREKSRRISGT